MRLFAVLIAAAVLVPAAAVQAAPRPCLPLVEDDRGDGGGLSPVPREDLDVLSANVLTSRDGKTLTLTMAVASMAAQPVEPGTYNVFFRAGQQSYVARGYRGADGEVFRLESDAPTASGLPDVRPLTGAFDPAKATIRLDVPLALLSDGKRALRRGDRLFGISAVTVQVYGAEPLYAGFTVDDTTQDNIYKIGAPGCAPR